MELDEGVVDERSGAGGERDDYETPSLTEHPEWDILTGSIGSGIP